jgi:hypothetical protein
MLAEKLGDHLQEGFGIELSTDLSMHPDRGESRDEVGDFHHMLSLALRISRHVTSIFEIALDFLPWLPGFQSLGLTATVLGNRARLMQALPNRRLGAWQAHVGVFERRIAVQVGA